MGYHIILRLLHLIGPVIIAVGCVIYILRTRELSGVVALVGILGQIGLSALSTIISYLQMLGNVKGEAIGQIWTAISMVQVFASLIFASAFVVMTVQMRTRRMQEPAG